MKRTTRTSRSAGYLEKIFRQLNADSFNGELEEPIITIQSTASAYGHVTCEKVWKSGSAERYELNISADWMQRPIENVIATMLHEMTHLLNLQRGIQDCSRGNTYHNKKFRDEAEMHMLKVDFHSKYGWTLTEPTEELLGYIIDQGWTELEMGRDLDVASQIGTGGSKAPNKGTGTSKGNKKSNSRKYICPCCGAIVRATRDLEIICKPCNTEFIKED